MHKTINKALLPSAFLLAIMLSVGCSDDAAVENEQTVDILARFNAEGKAWLSLDMTLPVTDTRSRAVSFADGDASEYAVKTLMLVLFRGSSTDTEDELTVASTYNVLYSPETDGHAQLTTHSKVTIQVTDGNLRSSDQLYLLAVANATPSISEGETFAAVKGKILSSITTTIDGINYFVMSNTPLALASDGTGNVTTLAEVDAACFAPTQEEAQSNPGAYIYLERTAAKVTVTESVSPKTVLGNTNIDFTTSDIKFALYNYNSQSYLVRHFNSNWLPYNVSSNYRFVESAPLPNGKYRTYWAEDVNYSGRENINTIHGWSEMNGSYYCAENTFNVSSMQDNNTTSVLVRIRVNDANDFYTTSVTGSDVIYQVPKNNLTEEGTSASSSFSRRKSNKVTSAKTIDEYLREWLMETNKDFRDWVRDYAAGNPNHVNIAVHTGSEGLADAKVTAVTQTAQTSGSTGATAFTALNLVDYFDDNITLNYYWRGYMFYRVPIRHFTDSETPWSSIPSMTSNTTAQAYRANGGITAEERYLGRYGVVRNNWYTINITSVTHVGHPVIPSLTTDADDTVEQLLNATLQISGWNSVDTKLANP